MRGVIEGHPTCTVGLDLTNNLRLGSEDVRSTEEEVLQPELLPDVERMLLDERDRRLLQALDDLHQQRASEPVTVAVVYGAQHARAVVTGLARHGYRVRTGDWLTAMAFD